MSKTEDEDDDIPCYGDMNDAMDMTEDYPESSSDDGPPMDPWDSSTASTTIESRDLDQWDGYSEEEFTLSICLAGSSVWAEYDFGMHHGIMYLPQRPYFSSRAKIPFEWRGRERGEGEMSFGPSIKGWIRFLGNGEIQGMINCYGQARFSGFGGLPSHGTRRDP